MTLPSAIHFRPLVEADLADLHDWLHRPHIRQWWGGAGTPAEVADEYRYLTRDDSSTRGYVALRGNEAIGFIQSYVVLGSGDGWWEQETDPGARGIDQFLLNVDQLGQGLGTAMVSAFVDRLFADPEVTKVQTDPAPHNERAIRCYRRAGFVDAGEVITPDGAALLMVRLC